MMFVIQNFREVSAMATPCSFTLYSHDRYLPSSEKPDDSLDWNGLDAGQLESDAASQREEDLQC